MERYSFLTRSKICFLHGNRKVKKKKSNFVNKYLFKVHFTVYFIVICSTIIKV